MFHLDRDERATLMASSTQEEGLGAGPGRRRAHSPASEQGAAALPGPAAFPGASGEAPCCSGDLLWGATWRRGKEGF